MHFTSPNRPLTDKEITEAIDLIILYMPVEREEIGMIVDLKIMEKIKEPYAVIYASEITEDVRRIVSLIESEDSSGIISVKDDERIIVLRPDEIFMVRVENEKTIIYTKEQKYSSTKRLYEFEERLGKCFMRISKSCVINLDYLNYVEPSWSGTMLVVLKNGSRDYISRNYVPALKKYLEL